MGRMGIEEERRRLLDRFDGGSAGGVETARALSGAMDRYIVDSMGPATGRDWAITAVGSYGRMELSFSSDVDCVLVHLGKEPAPAVGALEKAVLDLWNEGIHASVAVYGLSGAVRLAKGDDRVLASLLDRRPVFGDPAVLAELDRRMGRVSLSRIRRFARFLQEEGYGRSKDRHLDLFGAEPDLKQGRGCLRDLASVGWAMQLGRVLLGLKTRVRFAYLSHALEHARSRSEGLARALETLLSARHHVCGTLGMRTECLTRHAAAKRDFGPGLYEDRVEVASVRSLLLDAIGSDPPRRRRGLSPAYRTSGGMMYSSVLPVEADLAKTVDSALASGLAPGPDLWCGFRQSGSAFDPALLASLLRRRGVGSVLEQAHRFGLMSRLLPAFGRIEGLVPGDEVHDFTVCRHSVKVASTLSDILEGRTPGPGGTEGRLDPGSLDRVPLLMAALLHDTGRSEGPPHAQAGARIASRAAGDAGLGPADVELVGFLCRNHMVLSEASTGLDCDDPTVQDGLAARLQSPDRLDMLLLLSVADMRSLGPTVETGFREELLARAWRLVRDRMEGLADMQATRSTAEKRRDLLRSKATGSGDDEAWYLDTIGELPARLLSAFNSAALWRHLRMLSEARHAGPSSRFSRRSSSGAYSLTYVGPDVAGLLARITGRLALEGLSIQEARIFSLPGGQVLDSFRVTDTSGRILNRSAARERIGRLVTESAGDDGIGKAVARRLGSSLRGLRGEVVADIEHGPAGSASMLKVTGPDAPGLLHMVADILHRFDVDVSGAIVTTEAGMVRDTFFVRFRDGGRLDDPETIRSVLAAIGSIGFFGPNSAC